MSISVTEITKGVAAVPGVQEVTRVDFTAITEGTWTLGCAGYGYTSAIAYDADAAGVEAGLEFMGYYCSVSQVSSQVVDVTKDAAAAVDDLFAGIEGVVCTLQVEGVDPVAGTNEVQEIVLPTTSDSGYYRLTYSGQTTTGISYNANALQVENALVQLSTIGYPQVSVTDATGGGYLITFGGTLAETDVEMIVGTDETYWQPPANKVEDEYTYGPSRGLTGTLDQLAAAVWPAENKVDNTVTDYGPTGAEYHGALDLSDYVLKTAVVAAAWVVEGHDNYTGGDPGEYPTTADSKAEQLSDDIAEVEANKNKILEGTTILTVEGTLPAGAGGGTAYGPFGVTAGL